MGFNSPGDDLAGLPGRQYATQNEPAVLCQHPSVVEFQLGIARDGDETRRIVGGHTQTVTCLNGQRIDESFCPAVIVGLETLELAGFLAVWTSDGLTCGIARQAPQASIHRECLQPILRRQELDVESCFTSQLLWHRLVEPNSHLHCLAFGRHHYTAVEVVVIVTHRDLYGTVRTVHLTVSHLRHQVPLLGSIVKADGTTLHRSHPVMDDLDSRVLLIVEPTVKTVTEYQDIHPLTLEILKFVQL